MLIHILLHISLWQLGALLEYQQGCLSSMPLQVCISLLLGTPVIPICRLLWILHIDEDIVESLVVALWYIIVQNCDLCGQFCIRRIRCRFCPEHALLWSASRLDVGLARSECLNSMRGECTGEVVFTTIFLCVSLIISCPYLVPTFWTSFSQDVFIWSAAALCP